MIRSLDQIDGTKGLVNCLCHLLLHTKMYVHIAGGEYLLTSVSDHRGDGILILVLASVNGEQIIHPDGKASPLKIKIIIKIVGIASFGIGNLC